MNFFKRILLLGLLGLTCTAEAGVLADLSIVDQSTGKELKIWPHGGNFYVAGEPNRRYAIKITNRTGSRLLSVLSVDGINAITGQTAALNQSGYVLDSRESTEILGWRKSEADVAAFYFTSLSNSYASRTDRPANVGVIGVAVFKEYVKPVAVHRPSPRMYENSAAKDSIGASEVMESEANVESPSADSLAESHSAKKLGTGHGERVASAITYTEFKRASDYPAELINIYYDSRQNLIARGIIPVKIRDPRPQAFPSGFAPDPR